MPLGPPPGYLDRSRCFLSPRSFFADQVNDFGWIRRTLRLFFREDLFTADEDIQRTRSAGTHLNGNSELTLDVVFEAHGLGFDVRSKKAAFDLDIHSSGPSVRSDSVQ